jgi:RNA polymerase sigma factor (sigma-70 family)
MAASPMSEVIAHLRRTVRLHDGAGLTDGRLLQAYVSRRDEAALAALVRRHGPMVWGVCRRTLHNYHDAEDAFQATFLVLVCKAASIASPALLANWLYGVAHQTALKARATAAKRGARERQVTQMPEPATAEEGLWNDLQPLLDQELSRLPDKYRVAIVLCDLEGKTRKEAARQLGVPEGTLAARLARGRVMLAKRLTRHGLAVSGGALGAALAENVASAGVPTSVVSSTIKATTLFAAGQAAATGAISAKVAALMEGVLKGMLLTKLKIAVVAFLVIAALGTGVSALTRETLAAGPKSASASQDEGNFKETVLALEKRIWEAYTKQDVDAFKNLLADDFVCIDMFGRPADKTGELDYVARFRVLEYTMKDVKVVPLNPTSAIVSYEIHYKVRPTNGQEVESTTRRATSAWAQRKGKWWHVYFEDRLVQKAEDFRKVLGFDTETGEGPTILIKPDGLSEPLKKLHSEKNPPKE